MKNEESGRMREKCVREKSEDKRQEQECER